MDEPKDETKKDESKKDETKKDESKKDEPKKKEVIPEWGKKVMEQLNSLSQQLTQQTDETKEPIKIPIPPDPKRSEQEEPEEQEEQPKEQEEQPKEQSKKSFLDWLM